MISFLEGKIIFKGEKFIILDVRGVGYKIFLPQKTLNKIPQKAKSLKVFCYLNVRENSLELYGFLNQKELEFFENLIEIPSIGPKAALEISSIAEPEKIKKAIEKGEEKIIKEISKVGKKKAQLIILELSRKIKTRPKEKPLPEDEVLQALLKLGFSRQEIKEVLFKIPKKIKEPGERIKIALKFLGRK